MWYCFFGQNAHIEGILRRRVNATVVHYRRETVHKRCIAEHLIALDGRVVRCSRVSRDCGVHREGASVLIPGSLAKARAALVGSEWERTKGVCGCNARAKRYLFVWE